MTGEQRLAIALELHGLSCDVAREGIRRANPGADTAAVERLLHRRLELAPGRLMRATCLGASGERPFAISSALRKRTSVARFLRNSVAKVVFPAPLQPAMR